MGRELLARGAPFRMPEWSALALIEAPDAVQAAHEAFIAAGAKIVTTNSFAVVPLHLGGDRFESDGARLAALSGQLARAAVEASGRAGVLVAASLPPPCGAYDPDAFSESEGGRIWNVLVQALDPYADVWLAETLSSTAEARIAAKCVARAPGLARPLWLAFSLRRSSAGGPVLHSGESIEAAAAAARELGASALLFNCAPPELISEALEAARRALGDGSIQLGAYANSFIESHASEPQPANGAITPLRPELTPQAYATFAESWKRCGATIIGGCCGIGPAHIAALCERKTSEQPAN